jgi:hypothetical protein
VSGLTGFILRLIPARVAAHVLLLLLLLLLAALVEHLVEEAELGVGGHYACAEEHDEG